ncbi:benzoate carboxyl methyltransferase-like isoform X1 [Apium graveolens]|uniref:benzoate carboxyl methyltransferase-like isoform X1 n=1 Tax=Apium graveolens TaxID=4045 RepID=UPI003D7962C0
MDLVQVVHMNTSNHECSYADNSTLEKSVILKSKEALEDAIEDYGISHGFSECFKLADLGCSSGPTAFLSVTNIINSVLAVCEEKNLKAPTEFQVLLNDLPNNDFNSLFKITPSFNSRLQNENGGGGKSVNCFISGVPGSFFTRLFPSKSLEFVHSSYAVHFLSQIPEKVLDNNKGNVYLAKSSPPFVYEAYFNQFRKDFTTFLRMRSMEIITDGRMVLTLIGRTTSKNCNVFHDLLAKSLQDMLVEGLLNEKDVYSFNLPVYYPCTNELKAVIESESSFTLDRIETFEVDWDMRTEDEIIKSGESSGKFIAKIYRAVSEPLLAGYFGNTCLHKIYERYEMHTTEQLSKERITSFNIVVSLSKKGNN